MCLLLNVTFPDPTSSRPLGITHIPELASICCLRPCLTDAKFRLNFPSGGKLYLLGLRKSNFPTDGSKVAWQNSSSGGPR